MKHLDPLDGKLKKHDVEEWKNIVATFGNEWDREQLAITDILSDEFISWGELMKTEKQLNLFRDYDNIVQFRNVK